MGVGIYIGSGLGPGPRDGLMTGLQKFTDKPIALIRTNLEVSAVLIGFYFGGVVGIGTLLFAVWDRTCSLFRNIYCNVNFLNSYNFFWLNITSTITAINKFIMVIAQIIMKLKKYIHAHQYILLLNRQRY